MIKTRFKSDALFSQPEIQVDKDLGLVKGVVIVQEGLDKNGGFFTPEFLNDLIDDGNAQKQGVKSRFGHPNMCKTTLGAFVGRYKNFRAENEDEKYKVVADLHLDPITKKTQVEGQGISMWDYLLEMADTNPDMFGNSIHFTAGIRYETKEVDGEEISVEVYSFKSFIASDLVDSPAATDNLFKSSKDLGVVVTQFLDENTEVFELIQKDTNIIVDFFKRYTNYLQKSNKKINMKFLKKIQKSLVGDETKDIDLTLADGNIITVITDGEQPMVGDKVVDDAGNPVADGEHTLPDGGAIVTEGGEITEIKEPEDEGDDGDGDGEPTNKDVVDQIKALNTTLGKLKSQLKENKKSIELIADKVGKVSKSHNNLAKTVKSIDYDVPPGEPKGGKKKGSSLYDKVQAKLEEQKEEE